MTLRLANVGFESYGSILLPDVVQQISKLSRLEPEPDLELLRVEALLFLDGLGEIPGFEPGAWAPPSAPPTRRRSMSRASAPTPAAPD